ncbi:FadR/GntR family transcriptional regulator [Algibacillus agarilyticus]|uniref:FadR/GntR family transcriptional regulator n=1 Tax=Algibacillus agarilyticus TaxID=2234133 RepID=UPI000DCF9C13|nr:FadR/GntR family transcriptional regulator [Algibacillus agarilyticus]
MGISQFKTIKTDRLYVKVADQLNNLIENDVFKPGERFPSERELAEKLGVSRPTIREAMIYLEISGVIEIRTGSGIYVAHQAKKVMGQQAELDVSQGIGLFESLEMRYILEPEMCALAAARITDEQIAELRAIIQEMVVEEKSPNPAENADRKFHLAIAKASQNEAIYESINWLWELRVKSGINSEFLKKIRKEGVHPSIEEHIKIVNALEQRNPDKARTAMKVHIESSTDNAAEHFGRDA